MTREWVELEDGWRTWARFSGARWRYRGGRIQAIASDGTTIDTSADGSAHRYLTQARKVVPQRVAGVRAVTGDEWYTRALLAIALHECTHMRLPCFGDCRHKDDPSKVVRCGSPNAAPPMSVGLYQFIRSTVRGLGGNWDELATSYAANHRLALRLGKLWEESHDRDFIVLVTRWGAGSVRPKPGTTWGVVSWRSDTLTEFCRCYNAVNEVLGARQGAKQRNGVDLFLALSLAYIAKEAVT